MFLRKLGKRGAEMVEYAIVLACMITYNKLRKFNSQKI